MLDTSGTLSKYFPNNFEQILKMKIRYKHIATTSNKLIKTAQSNIFNLLFTIFGIQ